MQPSEFSDIDYALDSDGIVTVTLNTPQRKNALSGLTALELKWAASHFQADDAAHAMILTGAPDSGAARSARPSVAAAISYRVSTTMYRPISWRRSTPPISR